MYIYKITNIVTQKCYVGQTIRTPEKRFRVHCYDASRNPNHSYLHRAIQKYGREVFTVELLEECSPETLDSQEKFWIYFLNTKAPNGYNIKCGGAGSPPLPIHENECVFCSEIFLSKHKTKLYCSLSCEGKYRWKINKIKKPAIQKNCLVCRQQFTIRKYGQTFCSKKCQRKNELIKREKIRQNERKVKTRTCVVCQTIFSFENDRKGKKYCSDLCFRNMRNYRKRNKRLSKNKDFI